jgi:DNA invertase Pin-like site-specific DNA recombinase
MVPMKSDDQTTRKKAISYVRFSSIAQGRHGRDSTKRQKEALDAALAKWNLELDGQFSDAGKSGFHQQHLAAGGAMLTLRKMAVAGKVQGKVLVVEDFDRAGRMQVADAAPLLLDMLNNRVDLVVGAYGGEYFSRDTVNANPFTFYSALDQMNRGYGESKRKSDMAKSKWRARIETIANGKFIPLNSLPFWLENGKDRYELKPGMREFIRSVYAMYLAGEGGQVIANRLNAKEIPMPPRKNGELRRNANVWHSTFIQNLIKNRALLGYYHGTEYKIFPLVINETDFYRANQKMKERIRFSGRRAEHVNPYSGLCICAKCGGHLSRHSSRRASSRRNYVYLQCRSSRRALCAAAGMPYDRFEDSFSNVLTYVDNLYTPSAPQVQALRSDELRCDLSNVDMQIAKLKSILLKQKDPSKAVSLGSMLTEHDAKRAQIANELQQEIVREKGTPKLDNRHMQFLKSLFADGKLKDPDARRKIQEALRVAIDRITIDVATQSYKVTWKNSPNAFEVQLTPDGYEISGTGCIHMKAHIY